MQVHWRYLKNLFIDSRILAFENTNTNWDMMYLIVGIWSYIYEGNGEK